MPHTKTPVALMTFAEIAEQFGLKKRQVEGAFYHHSKTFFVPKHYTKARDGADNYLRRVFTPLGVKRLEFLCAAMVKRAAKNAPLADQFSPRLNNSELQKYPNIEKISKPRASVELPPIEIGPKNHDVWTQIYQPKTEGQLLIESGINTPQVDDDAVLDIAVKIIAERQAFDKIKQEITTLREENGKLKAAHLEMCQTLNLIGAAMHGWRSM